MKQSLPEYLILYDGACNFCNTTVNFIIKRDLRKKFRFTSLQSQSGRDILTRLGLQADSFTTLVLVENGLSFTQSTAALRIWKQLPFPWPVLSAGLLIPKLIRDWGYNLFSRYRYRLFGKRDLCIIPAGEPSERFIDS